MSDSKNMSAIEGGAYAFFANLANQKQRREPVARTDPEIQVSPDTPTFAPGDDGTKLDALFEASVTGVQIQFTHLSKEEIADPPHRYFDAALARQIALHLLIERFDVPKRRIAKEIQRNRESLSRAVETVEDRLMRPEFAETNEAIAEADAASFKRQNTSQETEDE